MRFSVPYGKGEASFETDLQCHVAEASCPACRGPDSVMSQALEEGLGGSPGFGKFARSCKRLLFILCDGTRPTPTALVLEHLHPHLRGHPNFGFIIATGSHRGPTDAEFRSIFGRFHDEFRPLTIVHDAKDAGTLAHVGITKLGTPVSFNRAVLDADGIVTINSVEPHYFAGYTGGRKSFLPGVSGYETIERNHSHACEPGALPMVLEGNPISEDMYEAAAMVGVKKMYSVQTVMTPGGELHSAFAGNPEPAFRAAVGSAERLFSVGIPALADIVITVAPPPMDSNLYQSQKALEHGRLALKRGGTLILVSSCWDGIGDRGFYDMLKGFRPEDSIDDYMGARYRLGNHKAARMLSLCEHAGAMLAVTDLPDDVLAPARLRGCPNLQAAVDEAVRISGSRKPSISVLPGGSLTVPRVVRG